MRSLPKSADLISVNNEEYFMARANYANQKAAGQVPSDSGGLTSAKLAKEVDDHQHQLSSSNGNIPHSLV